MLTTLNGAAVFYGALVGIALGLAGMGSVFAVPLLVYGLGLGPHAAVCVSMVAVVVIALVVLTQKSRIKRGVCQAGRVEMRIRREKQSQ